MKIVIREQPRCYRVGIDDSVEIKDCGDLYLESDEQVTVRTGSSGAYFDITRKEWGFYPLPSLNYRLQNAGLAPMIVHGKKTRRYFILIVEKEKFKDFEEYCEKEELEVLGCLDELLDANDLGASQ